MQSQVCKVHKKFKQFICLFVWFLAVAALIFIIFFLVLRKGFDFTDHGYYLYNAFILAHKTVPTVGFSALPNVLFMRLGIHSYLFYEIFYFLLIGFSVVLFWFGCKALKSSFTLPLLLVIGVSTSITTILSYQRSPQIFLLLALGLLFFSLNSKERFFSYAFSILAAVCFSLAGMSNISLLPTLLITPILLFPILKGRVRKLVFYITYLVVSILLVIIYMKSPLSIFNPISLHVPAHPHSLMAPAEKIPALLLYIFTPLLGCLLLAAVVLRVLISFLFKLQRSWCIPAFFVVALAVYFWKYISILPSTSPELHLVYLEAFLVNSLFISLVCFASFDKHRLQLTVSALIVISYACALALTTESAFFTHFALFAASSILISTLFFEDSVQVVNQRPAFLLRVLFFFFLLLLSVISTYFFTGYVYRASPVFSAKVGVEKGLFKGVYTNQNKLIVLSEIQRLYRQNHCQDKAFFAYPALPLLYYVFQRRAPYDQSWISPTVGSLSTLQLINWFGRQRHWCAIVAPGFNGVKPSFVSSTTNYLKSHSDKVIKKSFIKPSDVSSYPWQFTFYIS